MEQDAALEERPPVWTWRRRWTWPSSLLTMSMYTALALASFFGLSVVIRGMDASTARDLFELLQFVLFLPFASGLAQGYWWVWRRVSASRPAGYGRNRTAGSDGGSS